MRTSKMSEPLSDIHEIKKGKVFSPDTSSRGTEVFTGWDWLKLFFYKFEVKFKFEILF